MHRPITCVHQTRSRVLKADNGFDEARFPHSTKRRFSVSHIAPQNVCSHGSIALAHLNQPHSCCFWSSYPSNAGQSMIFATELDIDLQPVSRQIYLCSRWIHGNVGKRSNNRGQHGYKSFEEPRIIIPKARFLCAVCSLHEWYDDLTPTWIHSFRFRAMPHAATTSANEICP